MDRSVGAVCRPSGQRRPAAAGKLPATNVWLWGLGSSPACRRSASCTASTGQMITAVDLLRGLAALIGWQRIEVPGATGYIDTDYAAKGRYAVDALAIDRPGLRPRRGDRRSVARRRRAGQSSSAWSRSTGTSSARCTRRCDS